MVEVIKDAKKFFGGYDVEIRIFLFVVFGSIFLMHSLSSLVWGDIMSMLISGALGVLLVSYALKTKNGVELTTESLTKTGGLFILYGLNLTYLYIELINRNLSIMNATGNYGLHNILSILLVFLVGIYVIRYTRKKRREGVRAV
ncbi:MAG: hypothetical protein U9M95_02955 [Candidatus Altiarchaeota archaeon]|nr:hypothetical protein [Candidatus Altiarchaeota archaeon]